MSPLFFSSPIDYEAAFLLALIWTLFSESLALWGGLLYMQYKNHRRDTRCGQGEEYAYGEGPEGEGNPGGGSGDAFALKKNLFTSPWFSPGRIFFAGFFASFATLPYLWFILPRYLTSYTFYAFGGEAFVILGEALFYAAYFRLSSKAAFVLSLWCNLASLGVGKLLGLY